MTSRVTKYRQRLKRDDPEKYAAYVADQNRRSKERREKMKAEMQKRKPEESMLAKKEHEKMLARDRQRKYMERKKARMEQESEKCLKVKMKWPLTRNKEMERREYWRKAKAKERSRITPQKKVWIKLKDRERKRTTRMLAKEKENNHQTSKSLKVHGSTCIYSSSKTEYNATSLARSSMPHSPRKFAKVLSNLYENSSPRKRKALEEIREGRERRKLKFSHYVPRSGSGKTALKVIAKQLLKKASCRKVARETGLDRKTVLRVKQGSGRKAVNHKKKVVQKFYCREDVSRVVPQKRYATKAGPGYFLQISIKAAHSLFCSEHPNIKIGLSTFAMYRPKNVRLLQDTKREFCLCVYCINVRFKLLVLSRLCPSPEKKITSESDLPSVILCTKSDTDRFHKPGCIAGNCGKCKDQEASVRAYFNYAAEVTEVTWNHWGRILDVRTGKMRRTLQSKVGTGADLIREFVEDVIRPCQGTTFVQHIFTENWQAMQYNHARQSLQEGEILQIMDFGKNRCIKYQDEIKSAFFGAQQITVHPIVTYYKKNSELVRDSLIFVSNDMSHDFHAVQHFSTLAQNHIENQLGDKPRKKFIFSDGCSSQYKSHGPFADLSLSTDVIDRNFFGSEHGKCEGDGEMGVLNRAVDRAVLGRQLIINSAYDMFQWCEENLTVSDSLSRRHFFFVDSTDINRNRPYTSVKTLPQSRKLHQLRNVPGKPYYLKVRNLSCFCCFCLGRNSRMVHCVNEEYVTCFKTKHLKRDQPEVSIEEMNRTSKDLTEVVENALELLSSVPETSGGADVERNEDVEGTEDVMKNSINCPIGSYFEVRHGSDHYPAVVIQQPLGFEDLPPGTIYGHFFQPFGGDWQMNETPYLILCSDILKKLPAPDMILKGQRISYKFKL